MGKLDRMTLEDISEIPDVRDRVEYLGEGTVIMSKEKIKLNIKMSGEISKIENSEEFAKSDFIENYSIKNKEFLKYTNDFINRQRMYISNVEYSSPSWKNLFQHTLKGSFYQEKK